MRLNAPQFWYRGNSLPALLLSPLSLLYRAAHNFHQSFFGAYKSKIPVICVGNLVVGGSGKTPTALAIMDLVINKHLAKNPCFVSRGYRGAKKGPLLVNPEKHTAEDVGDEPLLLAQKAAVIIGSDRRKAAKLAEEKGFDLLVMDDGLQNPGLYKDVKLVVIDGKRGFGNRRLLPAGPLREPLGRGLKRADAIILIGEDQQNISRMFPSGKPIFSAKVEVPENWIADGTTPYIAFSGLAHPDKFRQSLQEKGLNVISWHPFPDHHEFTAEELVGLTAEADHAHARLITTGKDAARLPPGFAREHPLDILPVQVTWADTDSILAFLKQKLKKTG